MPVLRIVVLVGLSVLGTACGGASRMPEVQDPGLLRSAWEELRLDRAWPKTRGIVPGLDVARLGADPRRWDPTSNVSFHALLCRVEDRQFYFVTRQNPNGLRYQLSWLEVGADQPLQPLTDSIGDVLGGRKLWFGVQPVPGGLVVLYPDGQRIVELRATVTEGGLSFGAARTIAEEEHPVTRLQMTTAGGRLHAVWLAGPGDWNSLTYCSSAASDSRWIEPRVLSTSARWNTGCLAAGDRDIYVAWCDARYRRRRNPFQGYRNDGKVFLTASRDGGRSFAQAVVLNEPGREDDVATQVVLAVGAGGLALAWRLPETGLAKGSSWWRMAAIDFGLRHMHLGDRTVGGNESLW